MVPSPIDGRTITFATMHGKEAVVAPFLEPLGAKVAVLAGFDTDQFGTFTREQARVGDQRGAAWAKIEAARAYTNGDLLLASEGSFSPHPDVPFLTVNWELLVLRDFRADWDVEVWAASGHTSAQQLRPRSVAEALLWLDTVGFPEQGVCLLAPGLVLKELTTRQEWESALGRLVTPLSQGEVTLEADLRAHRNPLRRKVLAETARKLAAALLSPCPQCHTPGFVHDKPVAGLPCLDCGLPIRLPKAFVAQCRVCGRKEQVHETKVGADPATCDRCNP